jgi:NAD-dependent deacetylase
LADLESARALLASAERCLVLTGAGVSAESGVPTFRGDGGLWKSYRAEDLATPAAFARDPRLVWEWYGWRRELVARCVPNAAHTALARFARRRGGVTIATQNVDELHVDAARNETPDGRVPPSLVELHGSVFRVRCTRCDWRAPHRAAIHTSSLEVLPHCPSCGALARPDVVWFGEALDPAVLQSAVDAASEADVCLVIGTSAIVQPAASLAALTLRCGGSVIEVNPVETALTPLATVSIRGTAVGVVPEIVEGGGDQ